MLAFIMAMTMASALGQAVPDQVLLGELTPEAGPHVPGYRLIETTDPSRAARSVWIHLWYPAVSAGKDRMTVRDYDAASAAQHRRGTWSLSGWVQRLRCDPKRTEGLASTRGAAERDAPPAEGKHALVLYAASFRAPAFDNFALCEHLASHGFVVAAVPSIGADASGMTMDKAGVDAQLADLALAYRTARALPFVDDTRVGTMGFSLGAVPAALLAIRESARACVSIDGGMTYTYALLGDSLDEAGAPLDGAYLQLAQRPAPAIHVDSKFLDVHKGPDLCHVQWLRLDHYDMASLTLLVKSGRPASYVPNELDLLSNGVNPTSYRERGRDHRRLCRLIHAFLDTFVRDSDASRKELQSSLESKDRGDDAILVVHDVHWGD